jgi:hypothetical protein
MKKIFASVLAIAFISLASSFSSVSSQVYLTNHLSYVATMSVNYADGSSTTVSVPTGGPVFILNTGGRSVVSTSIEGITVPVGTVAYWTDRAGRAASISGNGMTGTPIDPNEIN